MNLFNTSNFDLEAAAQSYRDGQLNRYLEINVYGQEVAPSLQEFISELACEGEFTTPVGSVDTGEFLEHLCFSTREKAHNDIQMLALKADPSTTMIEAAQNWMALCKLMNQSAADFYDKNIVKDYQGE